MRRQFWWAAAFKPRPLHAGAITARSASILSTAARWCSRRSSNQRMETSTGLPTSIRSNYPRVLRARCPHVKARAVLRGGPFFVNKAPFTFSAVLIYHHPLMPLWQDYIHRRERWYHDRDNNRLVRPFEWGLEYVLDHVNGDDPRHVLAQHTARVMQASDEFYALPQISDYRLVDDQFTWTSALETPSVENNIARARYFPVKNKQGQRSRKAVVVLPQWNAQPQSHVEACRIFNMIGMAALRLTLPYHEQRNPAELERADHLVCTNIGRTIQSM